MNTGIVVGPIVVGQAVTLIEDSAPSDAAPVHVRAHTCIVREIRAAVAPREG